jgi:hypothetical protein
MHLRSGEVQITESDAEKVTVSCELEDSSRAREVRITFKAAGSRLSARQWRLHVRAPAGDLTVEGVTGNKDVKLHAGNLVIAVGNAADYRRADASLMAGDLTEYNFNFVT